MWWNCRTIIREQNPEVSSCSRKCSRDLPYGIDFLALACCEIGRKWLYLCNPLNHNFKLCYMIRFSLSRSSQGRRVPSATESIRFLSALPSAVKSRKWTSAATSPLKTRIRSVPYLKGARAVTSNLTSISCSARFFCHYPMMYWIEYILFYSIQRFDWIKIAIFAV